MIISSLELTNFRNYEKKAIEFDPQTSIFIGPNGIGKTNIIEAIYLLAAGGSWRARSADEMIKFGAEVGHISGKLNDFGNMGVILSRGIVQGKRTLKMLYKINGAPRRRADFIGRLKIVLFEPESLEIVIGDPRHRRAFLDEILTQTDPEYSRSSLIFQKSLKTRNRLLDLIREGKSNLESLEYWERALVKHGTYIQNQRRELSEQLGIEIKNQNSSGLPSLRLGLELEYQPNIISAHRLDQYRQNEIAAGHTFTGPQRDDFLIRYSPRFSGTLNESKTIRNLAQFGSRGEQRMAVLQLKLLEAKWIETQTQESPILLLDDIFSELDEDHEKLVGELIQNKQTIITATETPAGHFPEGKIVELI